MKPMRQSPSLAKVLSTVALGLAAVVAFPTPARALGDYVGVEAAPWFQGFDGKAAIDKGSTAGTLVDFKSDLGLDNRDTTPMGRVWFRWLKRNHLIVDYFDSSRSGSNTINRNITFNGTTYTIADNVSTDYGLKLMQAQYRYSLLDLKLVEVGLGVGVDAAKINFDLEGSSAGRTAFDKTIAFPTLNAAVIVKPIPGFHLRAEANGLVVNVSGDKVEIYDARVQLESYFMHFFGIFGGYRVYRFSVDANSFGHVENTFHGPYVGLGVKF